MTRPLISIVTPCYNEQENVASHYARVCAAIEPFCDRYDFEHIYTDNCSQDRTFALLQELGARHPNVRAMRFARNIGPDRAMYMGLIHARGAAAVLIQADLQDPPEVIPAFIQGWEDGYHVVYGHITGRRESAVLQWMRQVYYRLVTALSDYPIPRNAGDFRLVSREVLDALRAYPEDNLYLRGVIAHIGYSQKPVPYQREERAGGRSHIGLIGLVRFAVDGLTSTTAAPIRAVTFAGVGLAALGFILTASLVVGKLLVPVSAPHGITTIAALVTFFAGAQLFAIGVIGEYIRKIYTESQRRPRGFIKDRVNLDHDS